MKRIFILIMNICFLYLMASCNTLKIQSCSPIFAMDTTIEITFYNVDDYDLHYQAVKNIYYAYDDVSSDFESNDEFNSVYDLNEKRVITASNELIQLVKEAIMLKEATDSFYNPFIGRLSHLWKEAIKESKIVDDNVIKEELEIMNSTSLAIDGDVISLIGAGNLDLGGIAKGYATQKAKEYLDSKGITSYLLNAGSSNVVLGDKNGEDFVVALEKPFDNGYITLLKDKNRTIGSSSGKYQNAIIDGMIYHHILNPMTGYPANDYDSVNVMCDDSILCDAYSTAIFSMSLEDAKAFADSNDIDILLYKNDSILYKTDGWNIYE